ncbi:MAG: response regulator [Myxococcales bacterium]|nr:response regulator [Myxococcales bacterium]
MGIDEQTQLQVLDLPGVIVIRLDAAGVIDWISSALREVLGFEPAALIGTHWAAWIDADDNTETGGVPAPKGFRDATLVCRDARGEPRWLRAFGRRDPEGGCTITAYDTTEQRELAARLAASEARLLESQAIGHIGSWSYDVATDEIRWSPELCRLFGLPPGEPPASFATHLQQIHPDDRERYAATVQQALEDGNEYALEYRNVLPDGRSRHLLGRGRCHVDPESRAVVQLTGTCLDISKRKATEDALIAARRRAESANRAKSSFLAHISHEIRTPMNGILGIADLLRDRSLGRRETELVETIRGSARSLLALLDDLLDLSRAEAGRLVLVDEAVDVRKLTLEVCRLFVPLAAAKRIGLERRMSRTAPRRVRLDPYRLRQILVNLIGNAVKFTERGTVRVELTDEPAGEREVHLIFTVHDTGIGISAADLERIFEEFQQADESSSRRFGGAGLGLAISRRLAQAMGGSLVASSAVGEGSRFSFELRAPIVEEPREPRRPPEPLALPPAANDPDDDRPLRLLLAEDNEVNALVMMSMLSKLGHRAKRAHDGRKAIDALGEEPFDGVLMDCHMPVLDGFAATRAIRADPRWHELPIIGVTASAMPEELARCHEAGMDEVLTKPLEITTLAAALRRLGVRPELAK